MNWKEHLKQLSCAVINEKPIPFDFSQGYSEAWDIPLDLSEEERENEEFVPIYNFLYPLPDNFSVPTDFRDKLNNLTIIELVQDGGYYLALTGCGMDMTWAIVETYIRLGYYPPVHFCKLPHMAGQDYSKGKYRDIIRICNESLKTSENWMVQTIAENKRLYQ